MSSYCGQLIRVKRCVRMPLRVCVCVCLCICVYFQVFSRRPGRLHLIDYCSSTLARFTLCLFWLLSDNEGKKKRYIVQVKTTLSGEGEEDSLEAGGPCSLIENNDQISGHIAEQYAHVKSIMMSWYVGVSKGDVCFRPPLSLSLAIDRIKSKERRKNVFSTYSDEASRVPKTKTNSTLNWLCLLAYLLLLLGDLHYWTVRLTLPQKNIGQKREKVVDAFFSTFFLLSLSLSVSPCHRRATSCTHFPAK